MPTPAELHSTTQQFLDIYDITNDLVIMKDGSTSLIITVSAMNFGLLAEEEQDAIIYAYAGLLNSLNYPIQVVVKSQTKDATKYLNLLKEQEDATQDRYRSDNIRRYREFVTNLIHERNVLDKKFYVVIPASALEMGLMPPQSVVPGVKKIDISTIERSVILEKAINILEPKRDHLISQFARIGLAARQLTTQEIIQLFYTSYNPEAAEGQQITNTADYTTALVQAQVPTGFAAAQTIPSSFGSPTMTDANTTNPTPVEATTPLQTTTNPQIAVPPMTTEPPVVMSTPTPEPTPVVVAPPIAEAPMTTTPPVAEAPQIETTPTTVVENPISPMAMPVMPTDQPTSPTMEPTTQNTQTPPSELTPPIDPAVISETPNNTVGQTDATKPTSTPEPTTIASEMKPLDPTTPPKDIDRPQPLTPPVAPSGNPIPPFSTPQSIQPTSTTVGEIKEDPQAVINTLVQASDAPKPEIVGGVVENKSDDSVGALPPLPEI